MVSDLENNCKINKISGWGIETLYPDTINTTLGLSTIHLVGVDMDRNCKFNINYRNVFMYDIKTH